MLSFTRGDSVTFSYTLNNIDLCDIGVPVVNLSQDDYTVILECDADVETNVVTFEIPRYVSIMLVGGFPVKVQLTWSDEGGNMVHTQVEEFMVNEAYIPFPDDEDDGEVEETAVVDDPTEDGPIEQQELIYDYLGVDADSGRLIGSEVSE